MSEQDMLERTAECKKMDEVRQTRERLIIMGAAGRDFHNFNSCFRDRDHFEVMCFTAAQIPDIEGRRYPPALAGRLYPDGIPIYGEDELPRLIKKYRADQVIFSYSDVSHEYVMHKASQVLANGADFRLLSTRNTMLAAQKPVVSVCAVRTGCGKSQTTRRVCSILQAAGKRVVVVRHPMPYGDLEAQEVQRFGTLQDLDRHRCTIEEREEFEPHLQRGVVVYAGVDYEKILRQVEQEADVIVWDGGNNDTPFFEPDLEIVVVDPHRPGHELKFHPGETNLLRADVVVINKIDTAEPQDVELVRRNVQSANPRAVVIDAASPIFVDGHEQIAGKRVLIIEDGPTLTHGDMGYGAGVMAARAFGAAELVDPRPYAVGYLAETFRRFPHMGPLLPAMGYGQKQIGDLEDSINRADCDLVLIATPVDLRRLMTIGKPALLVRYELQEIGVPTLVDVLKAI